MKTNQLILIAAIAATLGIFGCVSNPTAPVQSAGLSLPDHAVFILNQGSGHDDGTLDCYAPDKGTYYSNIFESVNGVKLGNYPNDLAALGADTLLIVGEGADKLYMIDRHTAALLRTFPVPSGTEPFRVAVVNDTIAAVTGWSSSTVQFVNLHTGHIDASVSSGPNPEGITLADNRLVVCTPGYGDKQEVDLLNAAPGVLATLQTNDNPVAALTVSDTSAIVLCQGQYSPATNSYVDFINPASLSVTTRIPLPGSGAGAMALDGNTLYVQLDSVILRIDLTQRIVRDTLLTGVAAFSMAVDNVAHVLYLGVSHGADQAGELLAYDAHGTLLSRTPSGLFPGALLVAH